MPGSSSTTSALQRLPGASTRDTVLATYIRPAEKARQIVSAGVNADQVHAVVLLHRRDRLASSHRLKADELRLVSTHELGNGITFITRFQREPSCSVFHRFVLPRLARGLARLNRVLQALPPWLSGFVCSYCNCRRTNSRA